MYFIHHPDTLGVLSNVHAYFFLSVGVQLVVALLFYIFLTFVFFFLFFFSGFFHVPSPERGANSLARLARVWGEGGCWWG